MNDDDNYMHKYYATFLSSKNHEDVSSGSEYDSVKLRFFCNKNIILNLLLNIFFKWQVSLLFFVLNDNKLSSYMAQISKHINSSNHKIYSYDQISKIIVNLGSKKCEDNNSSIFQLNHLQNYPLVIIVDTPEKGVS